MSDDRLPPNDVDAEAGVLGAILLDSPNNMPEAQTTFPGHEVFYDLRHQTIYWTMLKLASMGRPVDMLELGGLLTLTENVEKAGGLGYVSQLQDRCPSSSSFSFYAGTVMETYRLRRMLRALVEAQDQVLNRGMEPAEKVLDAIESQVLDAGDQHTSSGAVPIKEVVFQVGELLDNYQRGVGLIGGIRTGFSYLDKMTGGLAPGSVVIIGGRPSTGKTSLLMNIVGNVAIAGKQPCGVFSMEMSSMDVTLRMMCARSRASFHAIHSGYMSKEDYALLASAGQTICQAPIYLDDTPNLRIQDLRARARRMHQRYGVKLIAVDYLQLMSSDTRHGENREREVAQISQGMKAIARELNVVMLVLAQLNRDTEKESMRKPRLSDLRDSGAIEQDADLVAMLYRPREDTDDDIPEAERKQVPVNLWIGKQRNGPTGDCKFVFFKECMKFEDRYDGRGDTSRDLMRAAAPEPDSQYSRTLEVD